MLTLSYEEWISAYPEVLEEEEDCPACAGSGESECPYCEQAMTCEACDGSGKVMSAEMAYVRQLQQDQKRWERYTTSITSSASAS
jgi:DnaJ-class molecular chaperone